VANFNLDEYETVEDRLVKFWADHPEGRIETDIKHYDERRVVIHASAYTSQDALCPMATGIAEETRGDGFVNKTSHVENCETSAIGRALANLGYATKGKRPSREEMEKAKKNPCTPEQVDKLTELALAAGYPEDEAKAKAAAMDSDLYAVAVKQLKMKAKEIKA
jgi:hypothetical protein